MSSFKNLLPVTLITFISWSTLACAEGEKLVEIRIQGNRRIESAAILNTIKMRAGDSLTGDKTDADIRAITQRQHCFAEDLRRLQGWE